MDTYSYYEITTIGGTIDNYNSDVSAYYSLLVYNDSPVSLSGAFSIAPTTPSETTAFSVKWQANVTANGFPVSICGVTISQDSINQPGLFTCYYNTAASPAAWEVQYYPDFIEKPQDNPGVTTIPVPTSGTLTLEAGVDTSYIRLLGSPTTLLGNYTVDALTGAKDGSQFTIEISGSVIIGANALTVFGQTIPAYMADNGGGMVLATYDAPNTVWRSILVNKNVTLSDLDTVPALSVAVNDTNATASLTSLEFLTDRGVLQRDGTALTTGLLTASNFSADVFLPQIAYTYVSSAEILAGFTTPVQILPAPTAGFTNWIHGFIVITNAATSPFVAYDTNTTLDFSFTGANDVLASASGILAFNSSITKFVYPTTSVGGGSNVVDAQALNVQVPTGNPLNGTGTLLIGVIYSIVPPYGLP